MGSTINIYSEIFPKKDIDMNKTSATNIVNGLLKYQNGFNYNSNPIIVTPYYPNRSIKTYHCQDSHAATILKFFQENRDWVEEIYVRTCNHDGNFDEIFSLENNISNYGNYNLETVKLINSDHDKIKRLCWYSFDEILYKQNLDLQSNRLDFSNYKEFKIDGRMNSVSSNAENNNFEINVNRIEDQFYLRYFPKLNIESELNSEIYEILEESYDIIFKKNRQVIHRQITAEFYKQNFILDEGKIFSAKHYNNGKLDLFNCSWTNCCDLNYMNYISKRKFENAM